VRSSASRPVSGASSQHPGGPPQPLRFGLALQGVLPGVGERDRAARQPLRWRVGQHRARLGGRLHAGRGVHRVAGHHPLADGTEVHRHLAGDHPGAGGQARQPRLGTQLGHRGHQVQRGTDGSLRVPFGRHRGAPDGHDRVSDELLHHPAVPADHRPGDPEILRQQLADRLRVPGFRQRGEPDDVAEQHRAHPPLRRRLAARRGDRRRHGRGRRRHSLEEGGAAPAAEALAGSQRLTARGAAAYGSAAIAAEKIVVCQRRTAPPAPHPALPPLCTSIRQART